MKVRIAARGSRLSVKQVETVSSYLNSRGYETEFIEVKTRADLFSGTPLHEIGKGVFDKEVNEAVLIGKADLAVHSMKDLSVLPEGLKILATPRRENPSDVLVSDYELQEMPAGSKIGTGSLRRTNFLKVLRPDLQVINLRGNVDTRIRKYLTREYDGIILAEAGLVRLGINVKRYELDVHDFTPEANQGIIAIVGRPHLTELLKELNDEATMTVARAEREAVKVIGGGCHSPLGVLFQMEDDRLTGIASYSNGIRRVSASVSVMDSPEAAGQALGRALLKEMKNAGLIS
ncbi:MAG: hydroxymethylbilane synthase [Metallosphaera sp.]